MAMTKRNNFKLVYAVGFAAYAVIYIGRFNFSVASAYYETAGMLTKAQIGIITSLFAFVYAVSKIPDGFLGDMLPARNMIILGLVLSGVSNLMICFSERFLWIAIFWALNAFGQAMLWGPLLKDFKENYDSETYRKIARTIGISIPAGSIIGLWIASFSIEYLSIKACFLIPAVIILLTAAVVRGLFVNTGRAEGITISDEMHSLADIAKNKRLRQMLIPVISHGMIKDNITFWMAVFFVDAYQINVGAAAGYSFFIPVFTLLGRCAYSWLIRFLRDDYIITRSCFAICFVCSLLLAFVRLPAVIAMIMLGIISALIAIINAHFLSSFPSEISETAQLSFTASFMDVLTYGGAGIGSLLFGFLISRFSFTGMFVVWAAASFASFMIMRRIVPASQ